MDQNVSELQDSRRKPKNAWHGMLLWKPAHCESADAYAYMQVSSPTDGEHFKSRRVFDLVGCLVRMPEPSKLERYLILDRTPQSDPHWGFIYSPYIPLE